MLQLGNIQHLVEMMQMSTPVLQNTTSMVVDLNKSRSSFLLCYTWLYTNECIPIELPQLDIVIDDDDEFRFNDTSTHEGHLRQNG